MKKNKELFLGYISIIYSITLLFVLVNNFTSRSEEQWRFFYAYTQQSNILVLIWLLLFSFTVFKKTSLSKFIRNKTTIISLTVYISITYFIVALVLDPIYLGKFEPVKSSSELWLHHLTPIFMWLMFFLVPGKGESSVKKSLLSLVYPVIYFAANLIIGANFNYLNDDKAYAYGFTNPDSYGGSYLILLIVILALLGIFSLFTIGLLKLKNYIDLNYHLNEEQSY